MDTLFHVLIPTLVALALLRKPEHRRWAILLAPLCILPDVDAFVGPHRIWAHNFLVVTVLPIGFSVFAKLRKPDLLPAGVIAIFYLSSHILFDLDAGISYLWPFLGGAFLVQFPVEADFTGSFPSLSFPWRFEYIESGPPPLTEAYVVSPWAFMLLVLVVLCFAAMFARGGTAAVRETLARFGFGLDSKPGQGKKSRPPTKTN